MIVYILNKVKALWHSLIYQPEYRFIGHTYILPKPHCSLKGRKTKLIDRPEKNQAR